MPVPSYDKFIDPVLRFLAERPEGAPTREAQESAADAFGLTEAEREERLPSGTQHVYKNRIGWAHDRLKRAGYSTSPRRGFWRLTDAGREYAKQHPKELSANEVYELVTAYEDVRLVPLSSGEPSTSPITNSTAVEANSAQSVASPDDRLERAVAEIRAATRAELLETLAGVSPTFFEGIVLDVLHKLGYGTSRSDIQRVGGSGDAGIDGVISLDRLGLEKVYVQAKRWQNTVGRPDVQAFYDAIAGQRATKGVFITTSSFTTQAIEFARSVERIVLIDGAKLADLMIDCEVGISMRPIKVPKLDSDYFDED